MKIKTKATLVASLLMAIPTLIATVMVGWIAIGNGQQALEAQARNQLVLVRETTRDSIEHFMHIIRGQILTFSGNRMVIDAMKLMPSAYQIYKGQKNLGGRAGQARLQQMREELARYYREDFSNEYRKRNHGQSPDVESWIQQLDDTQIALQHTYISANPNPLGEKDKLVKVGDNTLYDTLHQRFHPSLSDYQKRFGYYDIFLVDNETGNIVYSVFKEIDFSTNLLTGAWAETDIGKVFREARNAESADFVALSDYRAYPPSYNDQAAFIASPVFDQGKSVGVLIFQLPTHEISKVMTHAGNWEEVGLGKTGETYLVGADKTLRSGSRGLTRQPDEFINRLEQNGMDGSVIELLRARGSAIGILPVRSPAVDLALEGRSGFMRFRNPQGKEVLSAYTPLDIAGLNWALLAEMETDEALGSVDRLKQAIATFGLGISAIVLIIGALIGLVVGKLFVKPIEQTVTAVRDIAEGEGDLTRRIEIDSKDELGELAHWFNRFMERLQGLITELSQVTGQLGHSSRELSGVSSETRDALSKQQSQTEEAASAIHQLTSTIEEVAEHADTTARTAHEARGKADLSQQTVRQNIETIEGLSRTVEQASQVISRLERDSTEIGGVLDVIRNIAEQTNLLALNAAIEAARAGEQGRGFAVVADEVRTLASRTQESTQEIQSMIERLQAASKEAVDSMSQTREQAGQGQEYAHRTGEMLGEISGAIVQVSEMNTQIAHSVEEQKQAAQGISRNVEGISRIGENTAEGAQKTASASESLSRLAQQLQQLVAQFKV
jgi:methyl-accepting chemotaxis protein